MVRVDVKQNGDQSERLSTLSILDPPLTNPIFDTSPP